MKNCQKQIFQCLSSKAGEVEATLSKTRYISAMAESCINRGATAATSPGRATAKRSSSSRRRKKRNAELAWSMISQAAKSGHFFLNDSGKKRKVVSEIVKTGYVPSPDQELASWTVAAAAGATQLVELKELELAVL